MVDFIQSIKAGINAAETAQRNIAEIESVLDELNRQLADLSSGRVGVRPIKFQEPVDIFFKPTEAFRRKTYWGLAVTSKNGAPPKEVARWEVSTSGYPCTISLNPGTYVCTDKKGLEAALIELLKDPTVGGEIHRRMRTPVPLERDSDVQTDN